MLMYIRGNGGIAPLIFNLGTRWMWVVSFRLRPLYSRVKSPWNPWNRRFTGPQSRSGCFGEEKETLSLPGIEPRFLRRLDRSVVSIQTHLAYVASNNELEKCGRKRLWLGSTAAYYWSDCEDQRLNSVRVTGLRAEVWTRAFQNTKQ